MAHSNYDNTVKPEVGAFWPENSSVFWDRNMAAMEAGSDTPKYSMCSMTVKTQTTVKPSNGKCLIINTYGLDYCKKRRTAGR